MKMIFNFPLVVFWQWLLEVLPNDDAGMGSGKVKCGKASGAWNTIRELLECGGDTILQGIYEAMSVACYWSSIPPDLKRLGRCRLRRDRGPMGL